ncbi:MAG: type II toxin-antitoxin system HicB family antitoxin [Acidiferrobacteraceae bacterium]
MAKSKHRPDVGWDEKLKGYVCRALLQSNGEGGFEAQSKDLELVDPGFGATEKEAMRRVKENLRARLAALHGKPIPWCDVSLYRRLGARIVFCLVKIDDK